MTIRFIALSAGYVEQNTTTWLIFENVTNIEFKDKREAFHHFALSLFETFTREKKFDHISSNTVFEEWFLGFWNLEPAEMPEDFAYAEKRNGWRPWFNFMDLLNAKPGEVLVIKEQAEVLLCLEVGVEPSMSYYGDLGELLR